jgi:EAL domain-containing protein (putative c-di-GMP-specific phosphodiesterase class I)
VVGEGVEVAECLEFLREAGCDYAQGYFISKPISPQELLPLLTLEDDEVAETAA